MVFYHLRISPHLISSSHNSRQLILPQQHFWAATQQLEYIFQALYFSDTKLTQHFHNFHNFHNFILNQLLYSSTSGTTIFTNNIFIKRCFAQLKYFQLTTPPSTPHPQLFWYTFLYEINFHNNNYQPTTHLISQQINNSPPTTQSVFCTPNPHL